MTLGSYYRANSQMIAGSPALIALITQGFSAYSLVLLLAVKENAYDQENSTFVVKEFVVPVTAWIEIDDHFLRRRGQKANILLGLHICSKIVFLNLI